MDTVAQATPLASQRIPAIYIYRTAAFPTLPCISSEFSVSTKLPRNFVSQNVK